jgi:two-component system phosphate regulon sensor histidine kinase PhoR
LGTGLKDKMRRFTYKAALFYFFNYLLTVILLFYVGRRSGDSESYWFLACIIFVISLTTFVFWIDHHALLLIKLRDMVRNFTRGDLTPQSSVNSDDEIGELSEAMQLMAKKLNDNITRTLQEKDQMETILTSMVEGVLAFDMAGRLMLMNKTAEDMIGVTWKEAANHYFLEILENHLLAERLKRVLTNGKRQVVELKLAPGDPEFYRIYFTPIVGKEKSCRGAIMVLRNVTKVRLLEKMRSEFVSNVSHELRTPLTSIKGYVETLLDGAVEEEILAKKFLNIINDETDRLNRLIEDLFYLSQLETGHTEVAKKKINAALLVERVGHIIGPVAKGKKINLVSVVDPGRHTLFANQDMLEQVLINLLDNAVKYSHEGGEVLLEIAPHEQGTMLRVSDNGIGIPAESLPRMFERFYRVDKDRSRQAGGTGLGLSIVKHIVERHRGHVSVESEEGKGSTFTVIIPDS